ncbi:MAG: efflux transporter outer membrane subunit [Sphingomonadaceae bacterium]
MPVKAIIPAGIALLLAGCSMAPRYEQPVAPVAPEFPAVSDATEGRLATEIGWREYFADPRLQAYLAAALENNRDLAISTARIAQARAQYRIAESDRLPSVGATGGATLADGNDSARMLVSDSFDIGVAVPAFELDFWGRVRNLSDAARGRYLATVEAERAFRLSLIADVASTWYTIRSAEERIELARRSVATRREGLRIARLRLDSGVTSTIDHDQAELLVTQAETELADLERIAGQAQNLLMVLIGGPLEGPLPESLPLYQQTQMRSINPGLPSTVLASRPDIIAAEYNLRAANADIGAARAAFFPNISLTGNLGFLSTDLDDLLKSDALQWSGGGFLNLPIFDFGRRSANLRFTKAQRDEMVATYQLAVQQAFREVADGLVGRQRYAEQIAAQTTAVEAQRRLARAARLRYDNGISIYLEVLDAERNLFAAEQQLLALHAADLQNSVSLYVALGGGLNETAPPPGS